MVTWSPFVATMQNLCVLEVYVRLHKTSKLTKTAKYENIGQLLFLFRKKVKKLSNYNKSLVSDRPESPQ